MNVSGNPDPQQPSPWAGWKMPLIIAGILIGVAVVIGVIVWATSREDELPYTASEMRNAQGSCEMYVGLGGGGDDEELDCLREDLPELSDDQLRRLDHLIEQAEEQEADDE